MKVLIAGDSYASMMWDTNHNDLSYIDLPAETSWSRLLEKTYNWQVTNIAKSGSSLEHCYFALKKSDLAPYDKIIVVVTNTGRIITNNNINFVNLATTEQYISSVVYPKSAPPMYEYALAVKSYYENIYNPELDLIYFEAVLKKIIELVPQEKLILINGCCSNSQLQHYFHYSVVLHCITLQEIADFDMCQIPQEFDETDLHINHLTLENKSILSKAVYDLCTIGSSDVTLDDFKKMNPDEFSFYYRSKKLPPLAILAKSKLSTISKRTIAKLRNLNR